uniref:Uncharacterized protein n=1 Tax=uncultured marine microorganism HF4000_137B17 TaxID=455523 RepID=B3T276_9ZZZZ|nr:hypothetical protein ALOHA_HF4000137B17ctg1g22 [uncultured marine microorganism HF4000_137B17]
MLCSDYSEYIEHNIPNTNIKACWEKEREYASQSNRHHQARQQAQRLPGIHEQRPEGPAGRRSDL